MSSIGLTFLIRATMVLRQADYVVGKAYRLNGSENVPNIAYQTSRIPFFQTRKMHVECVLIKNTFGQII